jgi:uncharacterized membrane protein
VSTRVRGARARSLPRFTGMAIVGIVVGIVVSNRLGWQLAPVAGWGAACVVYLVWIWAIIGGQDPDGTREHATREDPGRAVSEVLVLGASIASLAAVMIVLLRAHTVHGVNQGLLAGVAVASVALSWTLIHTLYTLRYARMYYGDPIGGIDFNQEEPPRYSDFAYLAFDLGMTFQVSDTTLKSSLFRSVVLRHTLLSYVFGSVILATVINLVAGLGG